MRDLVRVIAIVVAIILVGIVGLVLYVILADLDSYKTDIEEGVLDATGFELEIGEFELDVGGETVLTATQVQVKNPDYPDAPQLASVGRLHLVIDNWSFLRDAIDVENFEIEDLQLNLQKGDDGSANWQAMPRRADIPVSGHGDAESDLVLHSVRFENIAVIYQSGDTGPMTFRLDKLSLDRQPDDASHYALAGRVSVGPVDTAFAGSGVINNERDRTRFTDGTVTIDGADVGIDGWFGTAGDEPAAEISLTAAGADLAALGKTIAAPGLPALPFDLSVDVVTVPAGFELNDLHFSLGEGELLASASVQLDGERPRVRANIHSPRLDLRSPVAAAGAQPVADAGDGEGLVFSDEPLDYSLLDAADVEAEIFVDTILLDNDTLSDANVKLVLQDRALSIDPVGFRSGDGEMSGKLDLRPADSRYVLDLELALENLRLGALAADGQAAHSVPPIDARLVLAGEGSTLHEIMAAANGRLTGRQRAGNINLQAAGLLVSDLVASILRTLNPLSESEPYTNLECAIYDIDFNDGTATIEQLAMQSDKLTIIGSGNVNLDTEAIDLTLRTKTREGLGVSLAGVANSFLKIGGTLGAPSLNVDAAGSVTTTGAAVATGGLSVLAKSLFDRLSAETGLCPALDEPASDREAAPE